MKQITFYISESIEVIEEAINWTSNIELLSQEPHDFGGPNITVQYKTESDLIYLGIQIGIERLRNSLKR